jgi:hypothetical protein
MRSIVLPFRMTPCSVLTQCCEPSFLCFAFLRSLAFRFLSSLRKRTPVRTIIFCALLCFLITCETDRVRGIVLSQALVRRLLIYLLYTVIAAREVWGIGAHV